MQNRRELLFCPRWYSISRSNPRSCLSGRSGRNFLSRGGGKHCAIGKNLRELGNPVPGGEHERPGTGADRGRGWIDYFHSTDFDAAGGDDHRGIRERILGRAELCRGLSGRHTHGSHRDRGRSDEPGRGLYSGELDLWGGCGSGPRGGAGDRRSLDSPNRSGRWCSAGRL